MTQQYPMPSSQYFPRMLRRSVLHPVLYSYSPDPVTVPSMSMSSMVLRYKFLCEWTIINSTLLRTKRQRFSTQIGSKCLREARAEFGHFPSAGGPVNRGVQYLTTAEHAPTC